MKHLITPTITLWGIKLSPFVRKVMIALAEKKLAYKQQEILPSSLLNVTKQSVPEVFSRISPLGKIPAIEIDDFFISDSAVINWYLDKKIPQYKLYPEDDKNCAQTIWFEHYSDTILTDVAYKKIFLEAVVKPGVLKSEINFSLISHAKEVELPPLLDFLEQQLLLHPWITGNQFTVADIAIGTQLLALKTADFEIDAKAWPTLHQYFNRLLSRPSFNQFN